MEFYLLASIAVPVALGLLSRVLDQLNRGGLEETEAGWIADDEAA